MSPAELRTHDLRCHAQRAVEAITLTFRGAGTTASEIMENSILQSCLELEIVESILQRNLEQSEDPELCYLAYMVEGIRRRLDMARESADFLATVLTEAQAEESQAAE